MCVFNPLLKKVHAKSKNCARVKFPQNGEISMLIFIFQSFRKIDFCPKLFETDFGNHRTLLQGQGLAEVVGALAQGPAVARGQDHHNIVLQSRDSKKRKMSLKIEGEEVGQTSEDKENVPPAHTEKQQLGSMKKKPLQNMHQHSPKQPQLYDQQHPQSLKMPVQLPPYYQTSTSCHQTTTSISCHPPSTSSSCHRQTTSCSCHPITSRYLPTITSFHLPITTSFHLPNTTSCHREQFRISNTQDSSLPLLTRVISW